MPLLRLGGEVLNFAAIVNYRENTNTGIFEGHENFTISNAFCITNTAIWTFPVFGRFKINCTDCTALALNQGHIP